MPRRSSTPPRPGPARPSSERPPRAPKQARSRETVRAIVEATRRVLAQRGKDALAPTEVARVAGVSVGTLYEYFRNKEQLLSAVEESSWAEQITVVIGQLSEVKELRIEDAVYRVTCAVLDTMLARSRLHGMRPEVDARQTAFRVMISDEVAEVLTRAIAESAGRDRLRPTDVRLAFRIVVRVVAALAWLGDRDLPEAVESGMLQDQIARMITHYLVRDADLPPPA